MRLIFTLLVLVFSQFFFNVAEAAPSKTAHATSHKTLKKNIANDSRRKKKPLKAANHRTKQPLARKTSKAPKTASTSTRHSLRPVKIHKTSVAARRHNLASQKILAHHNTRIASPTTAAKLANAHHSPKYQHARQTAMNKLMRQLGKPYQWGGSSPTSGFDCSGLVYYAYKDIVNFKIPRTANEMYHLRDAAPIKRASLQKGDLVFFRIHRSGAADHVGVYVGNGKFIQSPRTGKDIQITDLSNEYWQSHYLGARRVITPSNVR